MARTLGAKNKPKHTNTVKVINLNKHIENSPIINDITPYQWVSFGKDNQYPTHLLNIYHNSIIVPGIYVIYTVFVFFVGRKSFTSTNLNKL